MNDHWNIALDELRAQLSAESFDNWLSPIRFDGFDDGKLRLPQDIRVPGHVERSRRRRHFAKQRGIGIMIPGDEVVPRLRQPGKIRFQ